MTTNPLANPVTVHGAVTNARLPSPNANWVRYVPNMYTRGP